MSQYQHKGDRFTQGGPTTLVNQQSSTLNQYYGQITVTSRFQAVLAPVAAATSLVFFTPTINPAVNANSAAAGGPVFAVGSILVGSGFWITTPNSVAVFSSGVLLNWELKNPR